MVLTHSVMSGKKRIEVDGRLVFESKEVSIGEFRHPFRIKKHLLSIIIDGEEYEYGAWQDTLLRVPLLSSAPTDGWCRCVATRPACGWLPLPPAASHFVLGYACRTVGCKGACRRAVLCCTCTVLCCVVLPAASHAPQSPHATALAASQEAPAKATPTGGRRKHRASSGSVKEMDFNTFVSDGPTPPRGRGGSGACCRVRRADNCHVTNVCVAVCVSPVWMWLWLWLCVAVCVSPC